MKSLLVLELVLALVTTALSMSPPVLSESFSTKYRCEQSANMHPMDIISTGIMKIDYENKRSMSTMVITFRTFVDHTWYLDLYETKIGYKIHWYGNGSTPNGTCSSATIDSSLPTNWDWVNETVFSHTEMYKNKYKVDVFMSKGAPENGNTIAVGHDNPQIVYYTREVINNNFRTNYDYEDFDPSTPDPSVFIPPKECHKP